MGFRSRWRKWFGGKSGPTTSELESGGWDTLFGMLGDDDDDVYKELDTKELAELYRKNSLVHACTREIATSAAEAPLQVGQYMEHGNEDSFEPNEAHWANILLQQPNELYDYRLLMFYYAARKLLTGASAIWKIRPKGGTQTLTGPIARLWPIPTHNLKLDISKSGGSPIAGYKVRVGKNKWANVKLEDMAYSFYPDPVSAHKALGPLQAASRDVQLDMHRENYVGEMMNNLVVPGLGIFSKKKMAPKTKEKLREGLRDRAGKGHRGSTLFLEGEDVDAKMFNPLADLDLPGLITMTEARICSVYGVPAELVGARTGLEHSTYSNKAEARRSFYRETMIPFWRAAQSDLTRGILRAEGDDVHSLRFNLDDISELTEDADARAKRIRANFQAQIITRQEARGALGYEEDTPDGDLYERRIITE